MLDCWHRNRAANTRLVPRRRLVPRCWHAPTLRCWHVPARRVGGAAPRPAAERLGRCGKVARRLSPWFPGAGRSAISQCPERDSFRSLAGVRQLVGQVGPTEQRQIADACCTLSLLYVKHPGTSQVFGHAKLVQSTFWPWAHAPTLQR
jgi:hypothetical protein